VSELQATLDDRLILRGTVAYRICRTTLVGYLGVWHRFRVDGREHLPRKGGVLIASNHQSFLDIPIMSVASTRHVAFVARATLASSSFISWLVDVSGSVLVRQNTADRAAIQGMIDRLESGDCIGVFPEGTRTHDGKLGVFRAGAVVAARRAGVPIVPLAISGAFDALPRDKSLPRPFKITARFGPAVPSSAENALEEVKDTIERLLAGG